LGRARPACAGEIVSTNVGDVPARGERGIGNNLNLPTVVFTSVTRHPICGEFTSSAP